MDAPGRLFRMMRGEPDGLPPCDAGGAALGLRVPPDSPADVVPAEDGLVLPGTGGMSVTPDDPRLLPQHRRPPSLGGTGRHPLFVVAHGDLADPLTVRRDPRNARAHAFVEPVRAMPVDDLQRALCDTRTKWQVHHG